ncbi:alpha/beta-hydrolase [Pyrenochaeta sp. DS3sAY3a]|nr:alpha/beta-hydrolase [Pyrenochaeta sp. DS3sAY3a]
MLGSLGFIIAIVGTTLSLSDARAASTTNTIAVPTATLFSGVKVIGTASRVENQPSVTGLVHAYLGVPFANPPERFAAPKKLQRWPSSLNAQRYKPSCINLSPPSPPDQWYSAGPVSGFSEDCLYLNIYIPEHASKKAKKAVMFWIYGGNLDNGGGSEGLFNGSSLAVNHDVIVVVPNYRIGIFGFPWSAEIPFLDRNIGFLDQRLALQWVQENIGAFGGDKKRVTIFGESAGGYSVTQLLANPPEPLTYHAAIIQSPAQLHGQSGEVGWTNVTAAFGCTNRSSPLECLRKVNITSLSAYLRTYRISFPPTIDDVPNSGNISGAIYAKKFAKVPVLMGSNTEELTQFPRFANLKDMNSSSIVAAQSALDVRPMIEILRSSYARFGINDSYTLAGAILTDLTFTCPVSSFHSILTLNGYSSWRYMYGLNTPSQNVFPDMGAAHGAEVAQVWGTYALQTAFGNATVEQIKLSAIMQEIWTNFAKSSSGGPGWQPATRRSSLLGMFGGKRVPNGLEIVSATDVDHACHHYLALNATSKYGVLATRSFVPGILPVSK